ncbi:hypothetical protein C2G38_2100963 [Gigaspora rosea]|uniref:Uncharacterized protein n=1 Tax=Gigaspora rosea TaxID=44941 RepID=A0A397UT61_9GLOM|nr:hypothetical protein C2G38_2100963 [Gigaspora rosea]
MVNFISWLFVNGALCFLKCIFLIKSHTLSIGALSLADEIMLRILSYSSGSFNFHSESFCNAASTSISMAIFGA